MPPKAKPLRTRTGVTFDPQLLEQHTSHPAPRPIQASGRDGNVGAHSITDPITRRFVSAAAAEDGAGGSGHNGSHDGDRETGDGDGHRHADGADDGGGEGDAPPQKKKSKSQGRHDNFEKNRGARTGALTDGVPDSKAHEKMMLERDKEGRLVMLEKAPCPSCGECSFDLPSAPFIRVHVFTRCGPYDMSVGTKVCKNPKCSLHTYIPGAESAACFGAQAAQSRTGSQLFARDLLEHTARFLFRGSAFQVLPSGLGHQMIDMIYIRTLSSLSGLTHV